MLAKLSVPAVIAATLAFGAPAVAAEASGPIVLGDAQLDAISAAGTTNFTFTADQGSDPDILFETSLSGDEIPNWDILVDVNAGGNGTITIGSPNSVGAVQVGTIKLDFSAFNDL